MTKTILSFLFFLMAISVGIGQNYKTSTSNIRLSGSVYEEIVPKITLRNTSNHTINVHWEISQEYLPDGWGTLKNDTDYDNKGVIKLSPNEDVTDFKINFRPNGNSGTGVVEVTFYEENDRDNSLSKTIFTASINPLESATPNNMQIYPNPATEFIMLNDANHRIKYLEVYNVVGRKLLEFHVHEGDKYDISSLNRGMYMVRMLDENGSVVRAQRISKYNP